MHELSRKTDTAAADVLRKKDTLSLPVESLFHQFADEVTAGNMQFLDVVGHSGRDG